MAQRGYLGIHAEVPTAQCLRSASVVLWGFEIKSQIKSQINSNSNSGTLAQLLGGRFIAIASKLAPTLG